MKHANVETYLLAGIIIYLYTIIYRIITKYVKLNNIYFM
ncbi:hypothetical protein ES708_18870 [subsurface metagenome]